MARGKRLWNELDLSEKLGYVWAVAFFILVLGTTGAIIGPPIWAWWNASPEESVSAAKPAAEAEPPEIAPPLAPPPETELQKP